MFQNLRQQNKHKKGKDHTPLFKLGNLKKPKQIQDQNDEKHVNYDSLKDSITYDYTSQTYRK